jgi:PPK2 family polyphosphate:nucleotide phosphotransferase
MLEDFLIKPGMEINLSEFQTSGTGRYNSKEEAMELLNKNIKKMQKLQAKLYAENKYSVLIIFQAMDAAGKDGTIKHVMSGLNPQGTQVFSFKQPSPEELNHGFLWRINKALPERGRIGIFNRSHYEEVLVVRVHNLIKNQKIPEELVTNNIWKNRYKAINDLERYLYENGMVILKFFLHVSKEEQKNRFLKRIEKKSKNWKFSAGDIEERNYWDDYMKYYGEAISATSKSHAPWYIIPADKKLFMRLAVSSIIVESLEKLNLSFPKLNEEQMAKLDEYKNRLEKES